MQPDQDQYGFFMNPQAPQRKGPSLSVGTMSKKKLIALGAGGVIVFLILITLIVSILNRGPTNADQLLVVAQKQNELIRISTLALKEAKGTEARNIAATTMYSLKSDQATLIASLKAQNVKVGKKQLKAGENAKTDIELTTATQNNRFDEAYLEYIETELADYQKKLNEVHKTTQSKKLKQTLKIQYEHASTLIGVEPEV
jgi:hypothetical protein